MPKGNDEMSEETTTNETESTAPQSWEAYLESVPAEIKGLYEQHTSGLKSALQSEREARKTQEAQLRELAKKADKDSEAQKELNNYADQLAEANRKAEFYEEAAKPEIGCRNAKLAFIVAQSDGLFDKRGAVNWEAMKATYPELFSKQKIESADAGSGRGQQQTSSIDDRLRAALKR